MVTEWTGRKAISPTLGALIRGIEARLTGSQPDPAVAALLPDAHTYVLVLFDGLGAPQLDHRSATSMRRSQIAVAHAPFPTTTTVSMATVATGLDPGDHGVIGHLLWLPELGRVVNTLKWVTPTGERVSHDTTEFLPAPNLWERLAEQGVEAMTVQPDGFRTSPLTRALYRGCRFEGIHSEADLVETTVTLARVPRRMIFTYLPHVDFAAHVSGQDSEEYSRAMAIVDQVWMELRHRLPSGAALIGTSDHGHIDYRSEDKILIRDQRFDPLTFYGDPRALMVKGDLGLAGELAEHTGALLVDGDQLDGLFGPIASRYLARRPDAVLLAPRGRVLLPRGFDKRLTGYHGGLDPGEVEIPLLVG